MREQTPSDVSEALAASKGRAGRKSGDHGAAWMLLYLVAAALVAALVWVLFGQGV